MLYGKNEFIYIFLHKYCIKHNQNSSERAETLTDFSRGCNNNEASVQGQFLVYRGGKNSKNDFG